MYSEAREAFLRREARLLDPTVRSGLERATARPDWVTGLYCSAGGITLSVNV